MSPTTSNSNWNKLPSDILQLIFDHVKSSSQHPISTLKEATLVCKDWMTPAQQVLYQHVYLDADNTASFIYTICGRSSSKLAKYVKKATFCPGFETLQDTTTSKLNTITLLCEELSEMHGTNPTLQQLVWSFLKQNHTFPLQLQSILQHTQKKKTAALSALYTDVALKYQETMTQLQVAFTHSGNPLLNPLSELALVHKLPFFTALKRLRVIHFEENNLFDLNYLIGSCGAKVNGLCFDSLIMLPVYSPAFYNIPNKTIKNLVIAYADIPAFCLHYLSDKLQSLDSLHIRANLHTALSHDKVRWWRQLESLCLRLSEYSIRTNSTTFAEAASMLHRSTSAKIKKLTISTRHASSSNKKYDEFCTSMFKKGTTLELSLKHFDVKNFKLDTACAPLLVYKPSMIKIVSENMDIFYNKYTVSIPPSPKTMCLYFTPEAFTYKIRRYLARECNERNWCIFHATTQMIYPSSGAFSILHFDRMIFCDVPPAAYRFQRQALKLTQVYLTNSIIYYKMFYDLSERLPSIRHLTIDTCSILMEEQYSIRICLPFTKLTSLRYKVAPFLNTTSFTRSPNETSNFENDDLLNAIETNGGLIFKIETVQGIYTIRKKGDLYIPVGGTYRHLLSGTHNLFLIWIKCKDLDELIFDSNGKSSIVWKK